MFGFLKKKMFKETYTYHCEVTTNDDHMYEAVIQGSSEDNALARLYSKGFVVTRMGNRKYNDIRQVLVPMAVVKEICIMQRHRYSW